MVVVLFGCFGCSERSRLSCGGMSAVGEGGNRPYDHRYCCIFILPNCCNDSVDHIACSRYHGRQ